MAVRYTSFSITLVRFFLGAFFIILGICGIFSDIDESVFRLSHNYTSLEVVFGVVEVICGLLILFGYLFFAESRAVYWGSFIVLIFWCIRVILTKFVWGLNFIYNGVMDFRAFFVWLLILSVELIIAAALYAVIVRHN